MYKPIDALQTNMRSSLVVSGGIIAFTGIVLFVALAGDAWLALIAGGVVVIVSGFLLDEVTDRLEAPEGFHFCPFCSTLVTEGAERCSHCNGLQSTATQTNASPAPPNH
jgi:hypothetical protein